MTTYYVGAGGNDGNNGTTWALRKLTLNGAEDIPVAAADTVYVGPGTYRETSTCDVAGSAGSPITYIGDYDGSHTDGTGGVVRITGSDDDQTATRSYVINVGVRNYRTFRGFALDTTTDHIVNGTGTNCTLDELYIAVPPKEKAGVYVNGAGLVVTNSLVFAPYDGGGIYLNLGSATDAVFGVESCVFVGGSYAIRSNKAAGYVKNCTFIENQSAIYAVNLAASGYTVAVTNCIILGGNRQLNGGAVGDITEDYNSLYAGGTPRYNTNTGANSNAYSSLLDTRWFFELVNGGRLMSPFDLASYCALINVAGTSPTTTDMRGTAVQGAQREWGALEYDSTLLAEGGGGGPVRILPIRGSVG